MGILDAPAAQATADTLAAITTRLQMGVSNVVLQVLGDSTGVTVLGTQVRWPYLISQWLGQQYPAYTVNYRAYNDTTKSYDALGAGNSYVLQTGTGTGNAGGPYVLDVYNGSVSGTNAAYSITNLSTQAPVTPNAIIINHCHNEGGSTAYRPTLFNLTRLLQDTFPGAGIVLTAQNPEASTYQYAAQHLTRCQQVMDLAASEGYGLINVTQAFLNTPNWSTALLLADGIHPNDTAGSPIWANIIKQHLRRSTYVVPRAYSPKQTRIFIPASHFSACEGSPVLTTAGVTTSPFTTWALDKAIQQAVVAEVDFPNTWQGVNLYTLTSVAGSSGYTGTTLARLETGFAQAYNTAVFLGPTTNSTKNLGSPPNMSSWIQSIGPSNTGSPWQQMLTRFVGPEFVTYKSRPLAIRVRRIAADAADLLDESLLFRGVILERAA